MHQHESTMGVHMFPVLNPLPPPSPYHPSGSSLCTSPEHPVSCIEPGLAIHFIYDIIHVSMPLSQIIPPSPLPPEFKRLFYTSVSLLLSCIQGYHYHLSKFHIYALVYCIGEGNGSPLQCSCLENPRDMGAWWSAIYGVAQSRTRLKQLSSSCSSQEYILLKSTFCLYFCVCTLKILTKTHE